MYIGEPVKVLLIKSFKPEANRLLSTLSTLFGVFHC